MWKPALLALMFAAPAAAQTAFPAGLSWDWQLDGELDLTRDVDVLVLDLDDPDGEDIAAIKARGVLAVCYISVGTAETYRDDWDDFPPDLMGPILEDWDDERYLDIRARDRLLPIMLKRLEKCAAKGFDAVEPDNMDLYDNDVGFPITKADQIAYMTSFAKMAHLLGLSIAQKNAEELVPDFVDLFDFAIVEQCWKNERCDDFLPYVQAGKAVLDAEYTDEPIDFVAACAKTKADRMSLVYKTRALKAEWIPCP